VKIHMKKIDMKIAESYYKKRVRNIIIFLSIGFLVSFVPVIFAEALSQVSFIGGVPLHYYMGAQGSILVFIILLFTNAVVSDKMDRDFGIDEARSEALGSGKVSDH
jgi:putative solute:sodium symporter small subunit